MKNFELLRQELDRLIENCGYDMTDERVVKKSLELENEFFGFGGNNKNSR